MQKSIFSFDQRKDIRQEIPVPTFEESASWVREEIPKLLTLRNLKGKAMTCFSEREKQLGISLHDGILLIDTNLIENSICSIALNKNNYLFTCCHDAAQNAAMIYSLPPSCMM